MFGIKYTTTKSGSPCIAAGETAKNTIRIRQPTD